MDLSIVPMWSMFQWLKRQMDKMGSPTLDWVQVEVTTHCNGSCIYCPHTLLKSLWPDRHMPLELFHELIPFLRHTDLVYLQGWGEPLLNNDFFEMVGICKDQGKRVGFTTNGTLLCEDTIRTLVDLQLDIIGISLAGATTRTHNRIRKGTDFDKIVSCLALLRNIKAEKKSQVPAVHFAYLMLKSNFHELKGTVALAKRVGAKQVVASNLTLIVDPKLSKEAIFHDTEGEGYYRNALEEIRHTAARENIVFDYHGPRLDDASLSCRENVRRACVVNVAGEVVPCVLANPILCGNRPPLLSMAAKWEIGHELDEMTGLPPRERDLMANTGHTFYIFKGESLPLRPLSFGTIGNNTLTRIWNKKEYARFRDCFDPDWTTKPGFTPPQMPLLCLKCYKRLGV